MNTYNIAEVLAKCRSGLARCQNEEQIDRVREWAYGTIKAAHATPGACAADNTAVLGLITERQRELGIEWPASHEDEGE